MLQKPYFIGLTFLSACVLGVALYQGSEHESVLSAIE